MSQRAYDTLIYNGRLVLEDGTQDHVSIAIKDGKIAALLQGRDDVEAHERIDAEGTYILPGLVDSHVHINEPGREDWEGFETGSQSAAAGGVTTFIDMPLNSSPCTLDKDSLELKIRAGEAHSIIDFACWGGVTPENLDKVEELQQNGVVAVKGFTSHSGLDEYKRIDDGMLYDLITQMGKTDGILALHAENEELIQNFTEKLKNSGRIDRRAFSESHSPITETSAVHKALFLLRNNPVPGKMHFVHTTVASCVKEIHEAKNDGYPVTVEVCPHYLTFTEDDLVEKGPVAKCAPPLRSADEKEKLWQCVKEGLVDVIGSDHSPTLCENKNSGNDNIWNAWGGISGLQFSLSTLYTEGVVKRNVPFHQIVELMTKKPARLFGLYPKKGCIRVGADADIALFDPKVSWKVTKNDLHYKNKCSAYIGKELQGKVRMTLSRGTVVYNERGPFFEPRKKGRFIRPEAKD